MYELTMIPGGGFRLTLDGLLLLEHTAERPALFLGRGTETITMFRGNFDIRDRVSERIALRPVSYADGMLRLTHPDVAGEYRLWKVENGTFTLNSTD